MKNLSKQQLKLIGAILILALLAFLYRWLVLNKLEQTSALFIGLPTVLAIGFSLLPPAKSLTGMLLKASMISLLMFGIVFNEGLICIALAAPLFALVSCIVGYFITRSRNKKKARLSLLLLDSLRN